MSFTTINKGHKLSIRRRQFFKRQIKTPPIGSLQVMTLKDDLVDDRVCWYIYLQSQTILNFEILKPSREITRFN